MHVCGGGEKYMKTDLPIVIFTDECRHTLNELDGWVLHGNFQHDIEDNS